MKRTCLQENTIENQRKLNTDEQNLCEFHPVEQLFEKRILYPKDNQFVNSFVQMKILCLFVLSVLFAAQLYSQESVATLQASYSGTSSWDDATSTLTFTSTGTINIEAKKGGTNKRTACREHFWNVPTSVKKIIIGENVTVTGAFQFNGTCTVEGINRKTSVVYGTPLQQWADKNNPQGLDLDEWYYCQFQNENKGGLLTIRNLTSLNPFSYHVRAWNVRAIVTDCDFIDNRGGFHNHSDGFSGGDNSLVENCYFETADDIFKVYFDYTVRNCTIKMITNTVPIQLGWGSYSNNSVGTFENLTITGTGGRGNDGNAIIAASFSGTYNVTVNIDGCDIQNPNASWVSMQGTTKLKGTVTNANIKLKQFWNTSRRSGTCEMTICGVQTGSTTTQKVFDCRKTSANFNAIESFHVFPNPVNDVLYLSLEQNDLPSLVSIYSMNGTMVYSQLVSKTNSEIPVKELGLNGLYFIRIEDGNNYRFKKIIVI
jgi:hypothetical protein